MFFDDAYDIPAWPREMSIRVSDGATLLELLWLRHRALGNAEPALPCADLPGEPTPSADVVLVGTWEKLWKDSLTHLRRVHEADPATIPEQPTLWTAPRADGLSTALGLDAGDGARTWRQFLHFDPNAERAAGESTQRALQAGLRVVIEIPLRDHYTARLSNATLLVSSVTRGNLPEYREALRSLAGR